MRGARVAMGASLGVLILGFVALGQAQEDVKVTDQDRLWENFRREAAVLDQGRFRLEVQGITLNADRSTGGTPQVILRGTPAGQPTDSQTMNNVAEVSGGLLKLIGSYGLFENTEVGFEIQGVLQGLRYFVPGTNTTIQGGKENSSTIGDTWIYGKYRYPVNENLGVGGGVEVRIPTGEVGSACTNYGTVLTPTGTAQVCTAKKGVRAGTGEVGTEPFVATRYSQGRWAAGATAGWQFNTGDLDDMFHWSAEGILRASSRWAFRTEFTGHLYDYGGARINDVYCSPGIDYNFSENVTVRPQGQVGITDPALQWGLGIGLAYTF